jgi:DNA-binding MarR family transcriptional regulator
MTTSAARPLGALLTREELLVETLFSAARTFRHHLRPALEREGLTSPMFWALNQLVTDGPMSIGSVAGACGVTPANVSSAAEALQTAGLVVRRPGGSDRRVVVLGATPRGRAVHRAVFGHLASFLGASLEGIPSRELEATARVLGRLSGAPGGGSGHGLEVSP